MAITIDGLRLWQAQVDGVSVNGRVNAQSVPSKDSDQTLLSSLEAVEGMRLSGETTGIRLTTESGYSSDPQTALAQWLQQFETIVWHRQGVGWDLTDDERSRTITVVATNLSWNFTYGVPNEARWTLEVTRGEGAMQSGTRDPDTPGSTSGTPNSSATIDGNDLGSLTEQRTERVMAVDPLPIALGTTDETIIVADSGVRQRWSMSGRKTDTDANLRTFDSNIRGLLGGNQSVTFQTGMPGTSHTVVVRNYDSQYVAGGTAHLEYTMDVIEGKII